MNLLKQLRLSKGLTLEAMASNLHLTAGAVSRWENGLAIPRPRLIPKVARVLDVEPMVLMRAMVPGAAEKQEKAGVK